MKYKKLLPFHDDVKVMTQFGVLPLSVMAFLNDDKWECAYFEQDESEKRRSDDCEYLAGLGMSEFSSAICEFIVKYWSLENANIVDPFAGRATRAIISSKLNRKYVGYEISPMTYTRSQKQYFKAKVDPILYLSDGCLMKETPDEFAHLVMTCPPYGSIEKYESVPGQLSDIKSYDGFLTNISVCASNIYRVLKPGGFCCWVVGDWRDGSGYHQFSNDSINIFKKNGLIPHDTIIIKNNSPFAALQAGKAASKRISSKVHEYLLVFRKEGELDLTGLKLTEINKSAEEFFEM
jgi:DNA modification methylase